MSFQGGAERETGVTTRRLEAHYLAGGSVPNVIRAIIAVNVADNTRVDGEVGVDVLLLRTDQPLLPVRHEEGHRQDHHGDAEQTHEDEDGASLGLPPEVILGKERAAECVASCG